METRYRGVDRCYRRGHDAAARYELSRDLMPGQPATGLFARLRRALAPAAQMARYWRSSAAVLMGASALGVALAYGLPAVYESKAELEIVPAATPPHPESAADAVKALLSDQAGFGKLLHDSASPTSHVALPVDSLASHVSVVAKSERVISLSFRAGDAVAARSGCSLLADAIAARFDKGPRELARAAQA